MIPLSSSLIQQVSLCWTGARVWVIQWSLIISRLRTNMISKEQDDHLNLMSQNNHNSGWFSVSVTLLRHIHQWTPWKRCSLRIWQNSMCLLDFCWVVLVSEKPSSLPISSVNSRFNTNRRDYLLSSKFCPILKIHLVWNS